MVKETNFYHILLGLVRFTVHYYHFSDYEVSFIRLLDCLNNGSCIEVNETGTALLYRPGILMGGRIEHSCPLSRGIGYVLSLSLSLSLSPSPFPYSTYIGFFIIIIIISFFSFLYFLNILLLLLFFYYYYFYLFIYFIYFIYLFIYFIFLFFLHIHLHSFFTFISSIPSPSYLSLHLLLALTDSQTVNHGWRGGECSTRLPHHPPPRCCCYWTHRHNTTTARSKRKEEIYQVFMCYLLHITRSLQLLLEIRRRIYLVSSI